MRHSVFFFSSRRRHTRCGRDWSSDVCSSDLFVACRYSVVEISPIATQKSAPRKGRFEKRRISEREGWDALNETWGVFVGWVMWNKLEATDRLNPATRWDWDTVEEYLDRLETAYVTGELTGYFEPADQAE